MPPVRQLSPPVHRQQVQMGQRGAWLWKWWTAQQAALFAARFLMHYTLHYSSLGPPACPS